jgi:hypothetical protein
MVSVFPVCYPYNVHVLPTVVCMFICECVLFAVA